MYMGRTQCLYDSYMLHTMGEHMLGTNSSEPTVTTKHVHTQVPIPQLSTICSDFSFSQTPNLIGRQTYGDEQLLTHSVVECRCLRQSDDMQSPICSSKCAAVASFLSLAGNTQLALLQLHQGLDKLRRIDCMTELQNVLLRQSTIRPLLHSAHKVVQHGEWNEVYANCGSCSCGLTRAAALCATCKHTIV